MGKSLFGKLFLSYVGIILLTLAVISLVLSALFNSFYYASKEKELVSQGQEIADLLSTSWGEQNNREAVDFMLSALRSHRNTRIFIIDREGLNLAGNQGFSPYPGLRLEPAESQGLLQGQVITWQRHNPRLNQTILAAAVPFSVREQVAGAILLFRPRRRHPGNHCGRPPVNSLCGWGGHFSSAHPGVFPVPFHFPPHPADERAYSGDGPGQLSPAGAGKLPGRGRPAGRKF
jgi:hypothetical protein